MSKLAAIFPLIIFPVNIESQSPTLRYLYPGISFDRNIFDTLVGVVVMMALYTNQCIKLYEKMYSESSRWEKKYHIKWYRIIPRSVFEYAQ